LTGRQGRWSLSNASASRMRTCRLALALDVGDAWEQASRLIVDGVMRENPADRARRARSRRHWVRKIVGCELVWLSGRNSNTADKSDVRRGSGANAGWFVACQRVSDCRSGQMFQRSAWPRCQFGGDPLILGARSPFAEVCPLMLALILRKHIGPLYIPARRPPPRPLESAGENSVAQLLEGGFLESLPS
jgi:hypothetical protein